MNKNAIKKFAIEARKKLIDSVTDKAGMLGITEKSCSEPITKGVDFEVYQTVAGTEVTLNKRQCEQRRKLVSQIESRGFEAVVEEVAYTWFNRICAIRFMEVNDYLPNRVRVLSSEKEGKMEPDLVTQAPDVDLDLTAQEKEEIINWKMSGTSEDTDKLYCKLFLKQCHQLHDILPGLFEADSDYMELLFGISYTNKDDVIYILVNPESGIPEADFNVSTLDEEGNPTGQVEIIGWLYQYYNTELKDDTFAKLKKNVKITKERIPAATQLFTPDWIVRYMVENSVGKIWMEHLRAIDPSIDEKATAKKYGWKYYLPEAEQEESVNVKLTEIRTTYKDLKPTDITCIDPCMGSGHILIAMFDVLMDIYESAGYDKREAAFEIVEHNIHGLDIDQRAYQLAYFAVMMNGRGYNRRFLRGRDGKPEPKVYAIVESNEINRNHLQFFGTHMNNTERTQAQTQIEILLNTFTDARECGSILNVDACDWKKLEQFVEDLGTDGQISFESVGSEETQENLRNLVRVAKNLGQKYSVVVTNPPYLSNARFSPVLDKYVKQNYADVKTDLSMVMLNKSISNLSKIDGFVSFITTSSWMTLGSFEKLRKYMLTNTCIETLVDFGTELFEGKVGHNPIVAWVNRNTRSVNKKMLAVRLVDFCYSRRGRKIEEFFNQKNRYIVDQKNFEKIPGYLIDYWISPALFKAFDGTKISDFGTAKVGIGSGNTDYFLKIWYEISFDSISFEATSRENIKYAPINKGGGFRKWYGNNVYIIKWIEDGQELKNYCDKNGNKLSYPRNLDFQLKESLTWGDISSGDFSLRYSPKGYFFSDVGNSLFVYDDDKKWYILAFGNTKLFNQMTKLLNQTMHFKPGNMLKMPLIYDEKHKKEIDDIARDNIRLAKLDWDAFETSWDFAYHPLLRKVSDMENAFEQWKVECEERFNQVKINEEELNRIFIDIYGVKNELTSEIGEKNNSVRKADLSRDIRSFISYAIGCIFGRYSLDEEGLIYAGGEWNSSKYETFLPDNDNCIPITDEEYFSDDIVSRFIEFVKTVYGADTLEENLDFIANALGNKGDTSREVIRNYFLKDFYADHLKVYQKRPIYWLFDSGKQNGFKALIYMHRYDADTVGRVRTDYLHRAQKYVETAMQSAQYTIDNASSASEKSKATKAVTKYTKQLAEMKIYDEAIAHIANQRIEIDLDDGVKVNYAKFQGVEVAQEGKKALKVDLLAKLK